MIFLSHNYRDKILVEQIALRLRDIFGQDKVFYDSWSIQPGDGIIDKMNEGLLHCELFLFFVSKNSLQSNMVKLEWQNAIMKAAQGKAKLIPIKLDDCMMPPILMQNLFIDLYGYGLEVAIRQIIDITSGQNTFSPNTQEFSNLSAHIIRNGNTITIECHAEHYLEPVSHFVFLVSNTEDEISVEYKSGNMCDLGFHKNIKLNTGAIYNGQFVGAEKATVPGFPFIVEIKPKTETPIKFEGVMHEKRKNEWKLIPILNIHRNA